MGSVTGQRQYACGPDPEQTVAPRSNQVPGIKFSMLPFINGTSSEVAGPALWETYQEFFADKNEYGDAVLISVYASSGNEFFSLNDTPIETIEGIGSRKMWGLPGVVANTLKGTGRASGIGAFGAACFASDLF